MANQYAERDIMGLDKQGDHYSRHLSAMTGEGLHDKSDIAAELAYRDARIAQLEADCAAHKAAEKVQIALRQKADERTQELVAQIDRLDSELQEKALTDDGVIADAYWNCADKITPWLGEKTGPDTLINSVCGSLDFLIEQWREKKTLEQDRERRGRYCRRS